MKHLIIEDHMQKAYQQTQDLYKIMTSCEIIACSLKRFVTTFEIKIIIIMTDTKSSLSINGWAGTSLLGCQDTQKSRSYQRHPTENVTTQINQKTYLQYYTSSTQCNFLQTFQAYIIMDEQKLTKGMLS